MSTTNDTDRYANDTARCYIPHSIAIQPYEHAAWTEPRHIELLTRIAVALEKLVEDK